MGHKRFTRRSRGPGFELGTWTCTCDHRTPGPEQGLSSATINVVLEGLFLRHLNHHTVIADPTVAVVTRPGEAWRSSHPIAGVDRGVWVALSEPDRICGPERQRIRPLSPATARAWATLATSDDRGLALALIDEVLRQAQPPLREPAFVRRARLILASRLRRPPPLEALAEEVGVSVWHLCRTFRTVTQTTPRRYVEHLRLTSAARQIEAGCTDLATLALQLGFSSHSHLSARFRRAFGHPPSHLRRTPRT